MNSRLYKEWRDLQPLSAENRMRLDQKTMLDFNYNSNHLEGNTLTYGQTKLLLMFDETSGDAKLRDIEEMKAHNVGLEMIKREAEEAERPLTERLIRELNQMILVKDFYKTQRGNRYEVKVGRYKTRPNSVITATGETFEYASPEETPAMMSDFVNWYSEEEKKKELSAVELAALLHYRYIRIHPFEDGNGRIARLLMNYVLLRHGYPMIIVRSDDRENYLNVLHKCDVEVGLSPSDGATARLPQIEPFVRYVEKLVEHALDVAIRAAKGESIEDDDDFAKRIALLEREAKSRRDEESKFSEAEAWNILERVYLPVAERILEALKPAMKMFAEEDVFNCISRSSDYQGDPGFLPLEIDAARSNKGVKKVMPDVRSFYLNVLLEYPKREYAMENIVVDITFSLRFYDDHYTLTHLNDRRFGYGTYPLEEDVERIVSAYKSEVLSKIEAAVRE